MANNVVYQSMQKEGIYCRGFLELYGELVINDTQRRGSNLKCEGSIRVIVQCFRLFNIFGWKLVSGMRTFIYFENIQDGSYMCPVV
jgi:hypothetical protein